MANILGGGIFEAQNQKIRSNNALHYYFLFFLNIKKKLITQHDWHHEHHNFFAIGLLDGAQNARPRRR